MTYPKNKIVSLDRIFKFADIEAAIDKACKDITDQGHTVISTSINDHGKDAICLITNPRSQRSPRFQSEEELANSVGKINACYLL